MFVKFDPRTNLDPVINNLYFLVGKISCLPLILKQGVFIFYIVRNLLPYEKHLLPDKQDDEKNVKEFPPSQGEAMTNVTQSETIPPSTVECRYPLPGMNMQQMVAPFMKGNTGCVTSAYTVPYSMNDTSVPQVNKAFKQVSAPPASCSSGSSSLSYYGGGSGTNCGPYLANWRTAVPMNDASKTLVVKEAERKVEDLRNNNLNYRQDTFKVPHPQQTVINSGYSPRTCTSFSNYGGSSGMISSVTHTDQWRAISAPPSNGRDVLRRPQFNEPRSQTGKCLLTLTRNSNTFPYFQNYNRSDCLFMNGIQ